jgi:valyl-tRNA synthetase
LTSVRQVLAARSDKKNACRTIDASTAVHERIDFGEAGRQAYRLFWLDFADSHIEVSKARLQTPSLPEAACVCCVLIYMLKWRLHLWHPFKPLFDPS